jgi:hypothetical protein
VAEGGKSGREDAQVVCYDGKAGEADGEDVGYAALEDVLVVWDFVIVVWSINICVSSYLPTAIKMMRDTRGTILTYPLMSNPQVSSALRHEMTVRANAHIVPSIISTSSAANRLLIPTLE